MSQRSDHIDRNEQERANCRIIYSYQLKEDGRRRFDFGLHTKKKKNTGNDV
jgi:hypothetical protein